jgi:hypothetical protein
VPQETISVPFWKSLQTESTSDLTLRVTISQLLDKNWRIHSV